MSEVKSKEKNNENENQPLLEPQVKSLSDTHRSHFFWFLFLVFMVALPVFIFYITGYRIDFNSDETTIVTTGGIYITTDNLEVDVFLNDEQIERPRLFRNAYYIQNIAAGQHRTVVQSPGLYTWVKELPVYSHIVTEASAFNMPEVPHIRPISEYLSPQGNPAYLSSASTSSFWEGATTTVPVSFSTTTLMSNEYRQNEEFAYIESLFSSSSTSTRSVFDRLLDGVERFGFASTSPIVITSTSTPVYIERGSTRLVEKEGELYALWLGEVDDVPYYYCVVDSDATLTALRYGQHVATQLMKSAFSTTSRLMMDNDRVCRSEIKLDRLRQDVYFYDFFPDSDDLVLLQLEDGLYVTEIDDRSWQNVQKIYGGEEIRVMIENNTIYVNDGIYYFELVTEIE